MKKRRRKRHNASKSKGFWEGVRRIFGRSAPASKRKLRRKRIRVRGDSPELSFNVGGTWAWSLRVYDKADLAGVMQAASPLTCLTVLAPYFDQGHEPERPFKLLIRCNSNGRQLKLDRRVYEKLAHQNEHEYTSEVLEYLAGHFERDISSISDSTCVTVMTDRDGEVVDSVPLLRRAFGLRAAPD